MSIQIERYITKVGCWCESHAWELSWSVFLPLAFVMRKFKMNSVGRNGTLCVWGRVFSDLEVFTVLHDRESASSVCSAGNNGGC